MGLGMNGKQILEIRNAMGLSQVQFAQLFGVHFMTVSKWENESAFPSAYQAALMNQFAQTVTAKREQAKNEVKSLLFTAGVVAALAWLLTASKS